MKPRSIEQLKYRPSQQGSVLIMAVILGTVLSLLVGSLMRIAVTEMRLNNSQQIYLEASYAAETMAEYGFAELQKRWERETNFSTTELRDDPLMIPASAAAFFSGTSLVYSDFELVGGNVPPGSWVYVDPSDPANQHDPQKGKRVFQRDVEVYAKAVSSDASLGTRTAHSAQVLAVREAPLFSHAVFYNMDLEFHPGPKMDMQGPVHSNGDIYLQAVDRLRFYSTVMANGNIYHGRMRDGAHDQSGNVLIKNADGDWVNIYKGGNRSNDSSYVDSRLGDDWREAATDRWDGNVGSSVHGVPKLNPIGVDDYVPDNPSTAADERRNSAFAVIEPQVSKLNPNYKGDSVQLEQLSYKAGLVLKVDKVFDLFSPGGYRYDLSAYNYQRASQLDPKSEPKLDIFGNLKTQSLPLDKVEDKLGKPLLTIERYAESSGAPTSGFYDRRQETAMDVVELDMSVLADLINNGETRTGSSDPWNGKYHLNPGSAIDWNGVVYVEMPFDASSSSRADKVMPADRNVALRIVNAQEVPNPSFAKATGYDEGFTLATNGQLYVKGHFNADGDPNTGSSTETDDALTSGSTEAPAALFADSITILSDNFDDTLSRESPSAREAEFTEVSAAIVTGLVPSVIGGGASKTSGGAHNLPRFLEDWDKKEFRYRGSLVALYESEAGINPMGSNHSNWYAPPKRNWGYNELFADGIYPPGSPNARDFRRTDFRFLTEAEYNAALLTLDGFDPGTSTRGQ